MIFSLDIDSGNIFDPHSRFAQMYTYTRTLKRGAMVVEKTIAGQFNENMNMFTRKLRPAKFPPTE